MTTWHERMTGWHKSSYTHWEENACVEVGTTGGLVGIRDTKQRNCRTRSGRCSSCPPRGSPRS